MDIKEAFTNFNPNTTLWSSKNSLAMAYLSNLAYKDYPAGYITPEPFKGPYFQVTNYRDIQVLLVAQPEYLAIAFRGTRPDQLSDWMTDMEIRQISFGLTNTGAVHIGFLNGLTGVWPEILAFVKQYQKGRSIWVTGHSLGGALAVVCASALTFEQRIPINGLYTFGQPRVGNPEFCSQCDSHFGDVHFRYVNFMDIVTRVAPRLIIDPPLFYGHSGVIKYFDGKGILQEDQHFWNRFLSDIEVAITDLKLPIKDHDLVNGYIANIQKSLLKIASEP
jgi:triacylglycerol lipase